MKHPLLCKQCGFVIGWARRADKDKRPCGRCGRHTIFTIAGGKVESITAPRTATSQQRQRPERLTHEEIDHMMRGNRYVDVRKC